MRFHNTDSLWKLKVKWRRFERLSENLAQRLERQRQGITRNFFCTYGQWKVRIHSPLMKFGLSQVNSTSFVADCAELSVPGAIGRGLWHLSVLSMAASVLKAQYRLLKVVTAWHAALEPAGGLRPGAFRRGSSWFPAGGRFRGRFLRRFAGRPVVLPSPRGRRGTS